MLFRSWLYYNAAKFSEAKRWVKLAPADDLVSLSLRGKLAAMEGRKTQTLKAMAAVARLLPEATDTARSELELRRQSEVSPFGTGDYLKVRRHHFLADYGRAQLATNDFVGALKTFAKTDFWEDTAYIAERLLSVEELLAMERAEPMAVQVKTRYEWEPIPTQEVKTFRDFLYRHGTWSRPQGLPVMKHLLGRRLMREGYFKDAQVIFPGELAQVCALYAEAYRHGHNRKLPKKQRGEALWKTAQIHRLLGMELMGFETGPDHYLAGGAFELGNMADFRGQKVWLHEWERKYLPERADSRVPTFVATPDEIWRARHYGPKVDKRFHYRYVAADLAWQAAALMPNDDPKTAEVLCIAGNWLQNRDPKAADRFYKALVRRNPNVPLAQEADKKRWFPTLEWNFDLPISHAETVRSE